MWSCSHGRCSARNPPDVPWYDDARNYMRELLGLPTGTQEDYIKRIVAVGGDSVRTKANRVPCT